jgi:hypothetical protein
MGSERKASMEKKVKVSKATIAALVDKTCDAYSFDRFASWSACVALLLRRGYSEREAEAILRSKWMRWAGDASDHAYGHITSADLGRFLDERRNICTQDAVNELVVGTFGSLEV